MNRRSNIRLLRIVLNNVIDTNAGIIIALMDGHRLEDLLPILSLVLLTIPMIRGTQTHLKKGRFLDDTNVIGAVPVLPLIPGDDPVPAAIIVAGVIPGVQAEINQAHKNTAGPVSIAAVVENGRIKIGRLHVKSVNDENTKIESQVGRRKK